MKFYPLISGGKDSMTMAHYLNERDQLKACVFLDTGIASPRVLEWIKTIPYPLEIYKTPESFDDLVRKYGFGRSSRRSHNMWFNYLKGRALRVFKREHEGEDVFLASGIRKREHMETGGKKKQRWKTAKEIDEIEGMPIIAPLYHWSDTEVWQYVRENKIEISPFYLDGFTYSGECICGCFAQKGEKALLQKCEPELYQRIKRLEAEVGGVWGNNRLPAHRQKGQPMLCETCILV